jgi:hypothetical protein
MFHFKNLHREETPLTKQEFLLRLPPVLREIYNNAELRNQTYDAQLPTTILPWHVRINDFVYWGMQQKPKDYPNFEWSVLYHFRYNLKVVNEDFNISFFINLKDWYCRNTTYQNIIKGIKANFGIDFNENDFKITLV